MRRFLCLTACLPWACDGPVPSSANIMPADTLIVSGNPVQFEVEVRDQNGDIMLNAEGGKWIATNGPVEVSATGLVTGTKYGIGMVEYRIEDVVAEARVRVNPRLTLEASLSYINQAIQNPEDPIPLIPGRDGLLRLFVVVEQDHFYRDPIPARIQVGSLDTVVSLPIVFKAVKESELRYSFNATILGEVIEPPEIEVKVTYDPENLYDGLDGEETLTFEVADLPRFELTVVPTVSSRHPMPEISQWARDGLTFPSEKLWAVRKLLPVDYREPGSRSFARVNVHEVLNVNYGIRSFDGWVRWLNHMQTIRRDEGRVGYYLGVMKHAGGIIAGIASLGNPAVVSIDEPTTMSHELGHGMSLQHAPCNTGGDPNYPHEEGAIGEWGIDMDKLELIPPHYKDHMGYCPENNWVSDFFFNKSLNYRIRRQLRGMGPEPVLVLVLSGNITGEVFEPAFALNAVADVSDPNGTHLLTGVGEDGSEVFRFRFMPLEVLDAGPGLWMFNVAVPYDPERDGKLASVTLAGPGVETTLLPDSRPLTVMERVNGQIVSITIGHEGAVPANALSSTGLPK